MIDLCNSLDFGINMIELPEAITLGRQLNDVLAGKRITEVFNANSPHKFAFFHGDPLGYGALLRGKEVLSASGFGIFVTIFLEDDTRISFNDGVNLHYGNNTADIPGKYQLLLTFNDDSFLAVTVAMYGGIAAYQGELDNSYYRKSVERIAPLSDAFDANYFQSMIEKETKNISLKALLATEQRIPGIGNGVLQDILFNAGLHPKRKIQSLSAFEKEHLTGSIKSTLQSMVDGGGRDTENNLFGQKGGYATCLSKNTLEKPCPHCGGSITKESYMGGAVYYCPCCQPLQGK
jgi:formamidopyrimidine-DNA glycosylase